jgi:hypothetical protein
MKRYDQEGHIYNELEEDPDGNELRLSEFVAERDFVSPAMKEAGERVASEMIDAAVELQMYHFGGCQPKDRTSNPNNDIIERYVAGTISSCEVIYIAMNRVRVDEVLTPDASDDRQLPVASRPESKSNENSG